MQTFVALAPYILLAANTILLLALFIGINWRVIKLKTRIQTREASSSAEVARVSNEVKELSQRLVILEKEERTAQTTDPGAGGINSSLRGKALKMHRLGKPADQIAQTLRLRRGEVDLLTKVHAIVMRAYQGGTTPDLSAELVKKS